MSKMWPWSKPVVKVYVHKENILPFLPIKHMGITLKTNYALVKIDKSPRKSQLIHYLNRRSKKDGENLEVNGNCQHLEYIGDLEMTLEEACLICLPKPPYILGIRDCRCHTGRVSRGIKS